MVIQIILFLCGIILLYFGAESLVKGSSRLASSLGIRAMVIGLTIVAYGTSAPEAIVGILANLKNNPQIALGNIIGSNIANIGLILGISALVSPLKVQFSTLKKELPVLVVTVLVLFLFALDLKISRFEGLVLFSGTVFFTLYLIFRTVKEYQDSQLILIREEFEREYSLANKKKIRLTKQILFILFGLVGLLCGAHLLLRSAVFFAHHFGISEWIIGLTLVAIGTSLPEMATSIVAAHRKEPDIALGNVLGSNIFNILFALGVAALVNPIPVEKTALTLEFPLLLLFSIGLIPLLKSGLILSRREGGFLLAFYCLFLYLLVSIPYR